MILQRGLLGRSAFIQVEIAEIKEVYPSLAERGGEGEGGTLRKGKSSYGGHSVKDSTANR